MSQYVDGYVIPVKKKKLGAYKKMATIGCKTWMKYGAIGYYECSMDDFSKHGQGFKKMAKLKADETAIFAFVIYKNKTHRNKVNKKVMDAMSEMDFSGEMPFDMKRFAMAGCKVLVKANKRG